MPYKDTPKRSNSPSQQSNAKGFTMLVLSRKTGEAIVITLPTGEEIVISVVNIQSEYKGQHSKRVSLGIDAPRHIGIHRPECVITDKD